MKLILSRKGFDSGSGGGPSPVLPDGTMVSLPIPDAAMRRRITYHDIAARDGSIAELALALGVASEVVDGGAHLDPDLDPSARPRPAGWCPSLGQAGAAAAHLANQGVGPGDLFVFWGLYRHTALVDDRLCWDRGRAPFHAIFGWLQVGEVVDLERDAVPSWAAEHPHVVFPLRQRNTLYVAGEVTGALGATAGLCRFSPAGVLSAPGGPCSLWKLPAGCHPHRSGSDLSYHADPGRWRTTAEGTLLQTVARGQEFVTEASEAWLDLVRAATTTASTT